MTTPPVQRPDEDDDFFDDDDDMDVGSAMPMAGVRGRQALRVGDGIGGERSGRHARYGDDAGDIDDDETDLVPRSRELRDPDDAEGSGALDDDDDWLDDEEADDAPLPEGRATGTARAHDPAPFAAVEGLADDIPDDGIGLLPAVLTCEAGRLAVSVQEVRALQAGQVIDLGRPTLEGVSLMLDGREIARGMLVDLEGRFGIMLTALNEDTHHG